MKKWLSSVFTFLATFLVAGMAFAQSGGGGSSDKGMYAIASGLAIGLAIFGAAMGQGRAAAAALEGIARNPSAAKPVFTPFILGLALIESLGILAFVIAFFLFNKI